MQLNEKPIREKYKEFYGRNTEQMELLIKDKRIPMTMKQIIERRLNSNQKDWGNNYFDTCDAIVQFNGKIKIIKNCDILKLMNKNTKLEDGAIKITEEQYKKLKGKEFDRELINQDLTKEQARKHPIWKYLVFPYLTKYVDLVFQDYEKAMGLWINDEELLLMAWYVYGLGDRSYAYGGYVLGYGDGRLAGIASEMQERNE